MNTSQTPIQMLSRTLAAASGESAEKYMVYLQDMFEAAQKDRGVEIVVVFRKEGVTALLGMKGGVPIERG